MALRFIRNAWWPSFVFMYPLLALPGQRDLGPAFTVRAYVTIAFLVGGLLLELLEPDWRALSLGRAVMEGLRQHPPVLLAVAFGGWVVAAAMFAPDPPIALTGSLVSYGVGAVWMVAMVCVFVLVYVRTLHTPRIAHWIAVAVVASGVALTLGAMVELLVRHGLVYRVPDNVLPMVTFPQKGHLAGMIAMAGGVAIGLAPFAVMPVLGFGIGLCLNRTASGALLAGSLVPIIGGRRGLAVVSTVVLAVAAMGTGIVAGKLLSHTSKQVASAATLESRTYYYRAAIRGIAARPILGWGGGNFEFAWPNFLSDSELNRFAKAEWGFQEVLSTQVSDSGPPLFEIHTSTGATRMAVVRTFKAHDQLLEALLMWGIPGAILYLALFGLGLRGLKRATPLSLGIFAYGVFLLLWFVIPESQGVLWALVAASNAEAQGWKRGGATGALGT